MIVGPVGVESSDSEVSTVGVGSSSQTVARRPGFLTLYAGSSEDGGDGQEGGEQELSVEEHYENERREFWRVENGGQRGSRGGKAN